MLYQGQSIDVLPLDEGFVELRFDRKNESVNKFDKRTVNELRDAVAAIAKHPGLRGVLVSSAKDFFIVGADIAEFVPLFKESPEVIAADVADSNLAFIALEDLPVPSVVAINGFALGGGLELALACTYRVMSTAAKIGLPEITLGLFPGFGGTVRLPRIASAEVAIDWIGTAKQNTAASALELGVVDAVTEPDALRDTALDLLRKAVANPADWQARAERKRQPLPADATHLETLFAAALAKAGSRGPKHQPAAYNAIEIMAKAAKLDRAGALTLESDGFGIIGKTQAANSLVRTFLNEQAIKKAAKKAATGAQPIKQGAVLGAGIMGGGISYATAQRGMPVLMKDIAQPQLDLGMNEAKKLLAKQVKNGRMKQEKADGILASIKPQLDYAGFDTTDVVVEAVVENLKVKHVVLSELEGVVRNDTVIASNTSSLRIDDIAVALKRPENFVGMHFFNPVPVMPLVEVIKGSKTSPAALATAVAYAQAMGKSPIVVKDCPGFLVNRLLTAYMRGFLQLVEDGADFIKVDAAMEAFGWPMGPAYLEDVVGIDTGSHVNDIISAGYPERMPAFANDALRVMKDVKRYGQKNGIGFYRYEADPNGKPRKLPADDSHALLAPLQKNGPREFSAAEIVERMMIPMVIEAAIALEEGVAGSPAEVDMALLMGLGFPAYAGGPCQYADWLGLADVVRIADSHIALGKQFAVTPRMRDMAAKGASFY